MKRWKLPLATNPLGAVNMKNGKKCSTCMYIDGLNFSCRNDENAGPFRFPFNPYLPNNKMTTICESFGRANGSFVPGKVHSNDYHGLASIPRLL
jgi:hypothetical protein